MESAAAIERLAGIVRARIAEQPIVVVSAMGKTTNRLLEAADLAVAGRREEALEKVEALRAFHHAEGDVFGAAELIDEHFREVTELVRGLAILGELTPRSVDAISSVGERISSRIVALALEATHIDSRAVIVTDERHTLAAPLYAETNARLAAIEIVVGQIGHS